MSVYCMQMLCSYVRWNMLYKIDDKIEIRVKMESKKYIRFQGKTCVTAKSSMSNSANDLSV